MAGKTELARFIFEQAVISRAVAFVTFEAETLAGWLVNGGLLSGQVVMALQAEFAFRF